MFISQGELRMARNRYWIARDYALGLDEVSGDLATRLEQTESEL